MKSEAYQTYKMYSDYILTYSKPSINNYNAYRRLILNILYY